jgi:hypothetical protein
LLVDIHAVHLTVSTHEEGEKRGDVNRRRGERRREERRGGVNSRWGKVNRRRRERREER